MFVMLWSLGSNFYKFLSSLKKAGQALLTGHSHSPSTATDLDSASSSPFEESFAAC